MDGDLVEDKSKTQPPSCIGQSGWAWLVYVAGAVVVGRREVDAGGRRSSKRINSSSPERDEADRRESSPSLWRSSNDPAGVPLRPARL